MTRRYLVLAAIAGFFGAAMLAGAVPPAAADTFTFDFVNCGTIVSFFPGVCPGDTLSPTLTYTDVGTGTKFLTAKGYAATGPGDPVTALNNLFVKFSGPPPNPETGLGLSGQPNFEIQPGTFIQLDTSGFGPGDTAALTISSLQAGEGFMVCESSVSGLLGATNCVSGFGLPETQTITVPLDGGFPFVDITALSGDVLVLNSFIVTTVSRIPEPSTLALFLTGAAGLVLLRRQKKLA